MGGFPLTLAQLANLSGWAVLALLLAFGWLVPKRTVDREQALLEREAEAWKATVTTQGAQLSVILEEVRESKRQALTDNGKPQT